MKTNREMFLESLASLLDKELIATLRDKCSRCSNHYYDWSQDCCHEGINDSSCERGQAEWLKAEAGADVQTLYGKKYWSCSGAEEAEILRELANRLFELKIFTADANICAYCSKSRNCHDCRIQSVIINEHYRRYGTKNLFHFMRNMIDASRVREQSKNELFRLIDQAEAVSKEVAK